MRSLQPRCAPAAGRALASRMSSLSVAACRSRIGGLRMGRVGPSERPRRSRTCAYPHISVRASARKPATDERGRPPELFLEEPWAGQAATFSVNPRLVAATRLVVAGVVGMAAVAVGYEVGTHLLSSLESVPPLAHLEMFLGTVVSVRALTAYFTDREARSAVDQGVVTAVEGVKEVIGLQDLQSSGFKDPPACLPLPRINAGSLVAGRSSPKPEPTMLEVELRALVDASATPGMMMDGPAPSAVVVDRRTLIETMAEYIRTREQQARVGQARLLEDLEASEVIRQSLVQLQKSKDARHARREAEADALARLEKLHEESLHEDDNGSADDTSVLERSLRKVSMSSETALIHETTAAERGSSEDPPSVEDELQQAMERARMFREKLNAMKKSRRRRAEAPEENQQGDGQC